MTFRFGAIRDNQRGAAAVEFALIAGLLFTLLFGIIQFGQFYSQFQVFEAAAREGARTASSRSVEGTPTDEATVVERVQQAAAPYEEKLPSTISVSQQCTDTTVGTPVEVSWEQDFDISLPLLPPIDVTKTISGVFRCE